MSRSTLNVLILSPHRDDAAFSLALAIRSWLAAGHRVTILGVFPRSLTAPFSDADTVHPNDLLNYVSAMRRREDAEFLKLFPGLHMVDLNLKDAPLRLRCETDEVYTLAPSPDDTAVAKIHKALQKLSAQQEIDAFLIPLGIGHHVDHLVVRNTATDFVAGRPCAFYEDLPDALRSQSSVEASARAELQSLRESGALTENASPVTLAAGDDAEMIKRRIVSVYASQIDNATLDAITRLTRDGDGGERIWANLAWLQASF